MEIDDENCQKLILLNTNKNKKIKNKAFLYYIESTVILIIYSSIILLIFGYTKIPRTCGFECDHTCDETKYKIGNFFSTFFFYNIPFMCYVLLLTYEIFHVKKQSKRYKVKFFFYFWILVVIFFVFYFVLQIYYPNNRIPSLIAGISIFVVYIITILCGKGVNSCQKLKEQLKNQAPFAKILLLLYFSSILLTLIVPKLIVKYLGYYKLICNLITIFIIFCLHQTVDYILIYLFNYNTTDRYFTLTARINYPFFFSISIVSLIDDQFSVIFFLTLIELSIIDFGARVGILQRGFFWVTKILFCRCCCNLNLERNSISCCCKQFIIDEKKHNFRKIIDATKIESTFFPWLCIFIFKISNKLLLPTRHLFQDCYLTVIPFMKPNWSVIVILLIQQLLLDVGSLLYDRKFNKNNRQIVFPKYKSFIDVLFICGMCFSTSLLGLDHLGFFLDEMPLNRRKEYLGN